jgi:hypothetical protein
VENQLVNDMCEMPNIVEVKPVDSHEVIREKEGCVKFSKRVLNTLEEIEARIARIETENRNIREAKKMQRCSTFMRNTVDKI